MLRVNLFRPPPHYAGEIWKCSFISTVRSTVHTNPSGKRSFSKTLFKPEELENAGSSFGREIFWKRSHTRSQKHISSSASTIYMYAGEIWKSTRLFLRFGLPSTLIRPENGAFRKRSSNRLFVFVWTENILKTELYQTFRKGPFPSTLKLPLRKPTFSVDNFLTLHSLVWTGP